MNKKTTITLYGLAMSTCTQRVIAALTEKGLSFTLESIDFPGGEHKVR
jgi:glutathione S-transferase